MNETILIHSFVRKLEAQGWPKSDIIIQPAISTEQGTIRPDLILLAHLIPIAVIEFKSDLSKLNSQQFIRQKQQLARYQKTLRVPFLFVTDGEKIGEFSDAPDLKMHSIFPNQLELIETARALSPLNFVKYDPSRIGTENQQPKIYQSIAIARLIESVQSGNQKSLLKMPIGSGSHFVLQTALLKLLSAHENWKVLYLQDRIELLNQAKSMLIKNDPHPIQNRVSFKSIQQYTPDFSLDQFQLIVTNTLEPQEQIIDLIKNNPNAQIIALINRTTTQSTKWFANPILPDETFGNIYSSLLTSPKGHQSIKLGEIASIRGCSITAPLHLSLSPHPDDVLFFGARNLDELGNIDLASASRFPIQELASLPRPIDLEKYKLLPNDILITRVGSMNRFKVAIVPENIPKKSIFTTSLYCIRIESKTVDAKTVVDFLRSQQGQIALQSITSSRMLSNFLLTASGLRETPLFIQSQQVSKKESIETPDLLTQSAEYIRREILPILEGKSIATEKERTAEVASKLKILSTQLAPLTLSEQVLGFYPTPIALAYRRLLDSKFNIYETVLRLRDVFEAVAYFLYNVTLADYLRNLDKIKYNITEKRERNAFNDISTAARLDFIDSIFEIAKENGAQDLFLSGFTDQSVIADMKKLQSDFRNKFSHSATATETQQRKTLNDFLPVIENILQKVSFLSNYQMVRIPSFYSKKGKLYRRTEIYRGVSPELQDVETASSQKQHPDHDHIILIDEEENTLDIHPFYQFVANEDTRHENHLCVFKHKRTEELFGESISGAFEVKLPGLEDLEAMIHKDRPHSCISPYKPG